jgi:hypothetical protein
LAVLKFDNELAEKIIEYWFAIIGSFCYLMMQMIWKKTNSTTENAFAKWIE